MSTDPAQDRFQQQPIDLPDGGQFSIESLLSSFDEHIERLRAEGAAAQEALAQANAEAQAGAVRVRVDGSGHLLSIDFDPEQYTSANRLGAWTMDAWRQGVRTANQRLAQGLPASLGALVQEHSPQPDQDEDDGPVPPRPDRATLLDPSSQATSPRPEAVKDPLDDWFAQLDQADSQDFPQVLATMLQNAPFEVPDLTGRSGAEVDAAFAAENQQISDALVQAGSGLDEIEQTASHKFCEITVNAAGALVGARFHNPALRADPDELREAALSTYAEAAERASSEGLTLLRSGGLAPDDPSAALFQTPPLTTTTSPANPEDHR